MIKYTECGTRLPKAEQFLDDTVTPHVQGVYQATRYCIGRELRKIVERERGRWEPSTRLWYYDCLNIPYKRGTLIVERPMTVADGKPEPHRVSFDGNITPCLEDSVVTYLKCLIARGKKKSKEKFLGKAIRTPGKQEEARRIADKFF